MVSLRQLRYYPSPLLCYGGYHRVYYPKMKREQFAKYVVETITDKLGEVFPEV